MSGSACRTVERRATRMHPMMDRLHVDILALVRLKNGDAYAEARWRCLQCEEGSTCLRWLDKGSPKEGAGFCPNQEIFNACRIYSCGLVAARRAPRRRSCWRRAKARGRI